MVRALLVLCCSEIEMQILLSRPTSEFSHSLGQIRPSCSIAVYGSSSSDSCRSSRMPATAESGHDQTHAPQRPDLLPRAFFSRRTRAIVLVTHGFNYLGGKSRSN